MVEDEKEIFRKNYLLMKEQLESLLPEMEDCLKKMTDNSFFPYPYQLEQSEWKDEHDRLLDEHGNLLLTEGGEIIYIPDKYLHLYKIVIDWEGDEIMKIEYHKVFWYDHKPTDDNNGLVYGVSGDDDVENFYIEWFKTEEERNLKFNILKGNVAE